MADEPLADDGQEGTGSECLSRGGRPGDRAGRAENTLAACRSTPLIVAFPSKECFVGSRHDIAG